MTFDLRARLAVRAPVATRFRPAVWAWALLLGGGGCDGGSSPADASVCACFESNGQDTFEVTCSFEGDYGRCGTYQGCPEGGCSAELAAANAEVVQCTLTLLASGEAGTFRHTRDDIALFFDARYVVNGDGTTVSWSEDQLDLTFAVSAVEHRQAPSAGEVEACAALDTTAAQWSCLEDAVAGGAGVQTCTSPVSWDNQ